MIFDRDWFRPDWQPDPSRPVEFKLRRLSRSELESLCSKDLKDATQELIAMAMVLRNNVVGWRGLEMPCDRAHKVAVFRGEASVDWLMWLRQIIAELLDQALAKAEARL